MITPLVFLPAPRFVEMNDGEWALDAAACVSIPPENASASRSAELLVAAINELTGLRFLVGNDPSAIALSLNSALASQEYEIIIDGDGVQVRAGDDAGLFYGVQTLIQIAQNRGRIWPGLTIRDRPVLANRGVMLDVSRGKVPTLESLLDLVGVLALYKYNQFQLYFEHTFAFPNHPEISAGADPLTSDDIRALDARCRELHIELIPNLQSIGHLRPLLGLPEYQHLAETDWHWSFSSTSDEGFAFLDQLYGEMMAAFSSNKFNVNADEPWDFGRGKSKQRTAEIGLNRLYLEHIKRLHDLVSGHGKQMLMWADMFWRYPELVTELPEDILLLDWWYESKPDYKTVDVLKEAGRDFYVCAATSSWSTLYPRMENAIANIRDFVKAGVAAGASGMIVSDWGDNGHFQPLSNSWYAYLLGAAAGWTGAKAPLGAFDAAFGTLFLRDSSGRQVAAMRRLGAAMQTAPDWFTSWHSAMALFEDPICGKVASLSSVDEVSEARAAAIGMQALLAEIHDPNLRADLGFATEQIVFACDKVETTRAVRGLLNDISAGQLDQNMVAGSFSRLLGDFQDQRSRLTAMESEFELRWLAHARRSGIQQNLDRYEKLIERYEVGIRWLERQRQAVLEGSAVDPELATYDRGGYAVLHEATRRQIQELVDIIGRDAIPPDLIPWVDAPF